MVFLNQPMQGSRNSRIIDAALSCGLLLLAGVAAIGVFGVIFYPILGWYGIGLGLIFGFPSGIVIGIWLLSFAVKHPS